MQFIPNDIWNQAMLYSDYRQLADDLYAQGKTTGENHSSSMLEYTRMNIQRMQRLDRSTKLTEATLTALNQVDRPQKWLVITEAWCGDAAQTVPIMVKMAAANPLIEFRVILRDEQPALMDQFLTNGARSIPVLIMMEANFEVLGSWAPRPEPAQQMALNGKVKSQSLTPEERKVFNQELKKELQKWYARDKTQTTQEEISRMLREVTTIGCA